MGGLLDPDLLLDRRQTVQAKIRHGFLCVLNRLLIKLHPAGIGKVNKVAAGSGKLLQVAVSQFHPLLLPLCGDREPINTAATNNQLGFESFGLQEESLEPLIA